MGLANLKISVPNSKRPIDPLDLFNRLTLRGSIQNIWEPQAEALKAWHKHRDRNDTVVRINTGGGKTLVGLLMAQSLANETRGRVLYVCPNNQLVEQSLKKAVEIGLNPACRFKSQWGNREGFDAGDVFCITNYAALFNGRSVFSADGVEAVVFDDAHVADHAIRSEFTLKVPQGHKAFGKIVVELRRHFTNSGLAGTLQDTLGGRHGSFLFVPTFVVARHAALLRQALLDSGVSDADETKFAWEHLRERLAQCCVMVGPKGLEIAPPILPVSELQAFSDKARRIYLTATTPSHAAFTRTFGVSNAALIEPSGKSGDAQRLFVFVAGDSDEKQREAAKSLVTDKKSCVISPSQNAGQQWVPPATLFDRKAGQAQIDLFAESKVAQMLGLVARYDGIDLPGDACRILILDRLPVGELLLDRFMDEGLRIQALRTSHAATRIVQAIGRNFRSNTDHGVVMVVGAALQSWLRTKNNARYLPSLLQQQLLFAAELSKGVTAGEATWEELIDGVLDGDPNWDALYNTHVGAFETGSAPQPNEWYTTLVQREHEAFGLLWRHQYRKASDLLSDMATEAFSHDARLAAWYSHWRGLGLMLADDREAAFEAYAEAANVRVELGRPSVQRDGAFNFADVGVPGEQAKRLANIYRTKRTQLSSLPSQIEPDLAYCPETGKAEESFRKLGILLGLRAERPDNVKTKTGPDVKWVCGGTTEAWGLELKTNKNADGEYSKSDISQSLDHQNALSEQHGDKARLGIIGRLLRVSEKAHPSQDMLVIPLEQFSGLLDRARAMLDAVEAGDKADLERAFQKWLTYYGLLWPGCVEALDSRLAIDLRDRD